MDMLGYILGAYGAAALLIAALIVATWWRRRHVDQQLAEHERAQRP